MSERTQKLWHQAARILAIRLDAMGDVLMTSPALRALKESAPGRRLTLLTSPSGAAIGNWIPAVDELLIYEAPWMKASLRRNNSHVDEQMIERLHAEHFDAAVIFTVYSQNPLPAALLCYLADIPLRLAHCHENPYALLTDWVKDPEPGEGIRHEVRRQLDLVAAVGCQTENEHLSVRVSETARAGIQRRLQAIGLMPQQPWIVVHPGATAPSRRYPLEHFAVVSQQLVREGRYQILFTGHADDRELVKEIQQRMNAPSFSLVGELELPELVALIAEAPLLITNNTGPAHIAAAVNTPVVDLYALTNPQHTPWSVAHRVLFHDVSCKYCYKSICPEGHHNCLRLVDPQTVVQATQELWESQYPSASILRT